ncbi:M15 family metallopeptidase [Hymenobacter psychrophilus]|uniref:Peptidoglycan L-alanyl-D-glutamate endopeptidase CwlK n=1 Tax=Hymenobacter psychrophilus TaxID=651662 RepID=A0A1H3IS80_9BACT|nr:M15 family metallopeptidase [Hymenobacter psychrophilus]SDY30099.1 peptidoglycan L-alanyl-D-glutamate endopeptidase CwlK [Hymenobacter psychrophilus]
MIRLSSAQAGRQATRLAGVRPALRVAFARALLAWVNTPELARLGRPIVTQGYRSAAEQDALYAQGRTRPGLIVTYKRGGESKHNTQPARALDVALLLANGQVSWSAELLGRFARLMLLADPAIRWGGYWPKFKDRPHFEV